MVTLEGGISFVLRAGAVSSMALMIVGLLTDQCLISAGVALLIITPVIRVLISSIGFAARREGAFVLLGSYVMLIFVISVLLAI